MTISLQAAKRTDAVAADMRSEGFIPGVVYGGDRTDSASFSVPYNEFEKVYNEAGASTLIDFTLEGEKEPVKVVVQDVQFDPVKGVIVHIDLKQIKMGEEMQATVELVFTGEAPAVKEQGGTLVEGTNNVTIKCLPKDLLSTIEVDLNVLDSFEASIKVSDLKVPDSVTILDEESTMVATVSAPVSEEKLAAMEEAADAASVDSVEVEEKGKKEEGEAGAGEAPKAEEKSE